MECAYTFEEHTNPLINAQTHTYKHMIVEYNGNHKWNQQVLSNPFEVL